MKSEEPIAMPEYVKLAETVKSAEFQTKLLDDDRHWADRAEEVRTIAGNLKDLQAKRLLMQLAVDYDSMALHAVRRRLAKRFE
jgi:hypothetical protein